MIIIMIKKKTNFLFIDTIIIFIRIYFVPFRIRIKRKEI